VTGSFRAALEVFRIRNYRLFWFGGLISNIGRWFQTVAVPIVVFDLTGSAAWVGLAGFAQIMPMALMGPWGGAIADRYQRRKVLLVTQLLQSLPALGMAALWFGGVRSAAAFVAMSVAVGVSAGLNLPAWQAIVADLVPRQQMLSGITLNSAQFNASRMVGPALGGAVVAGWGPGVAFVVNAVSYGAVLTGLALMRFDSDAARRAAPMRPVRDFVGAATYAFAQRGIRTALLAVTMIGFFGMSMQMLSVTVAEDVFDQGERGFGYILSFVGLGAVLSSPFVAGAAARFKRSQIQSFAFLLYAAGTLVIAFSPVFAVVLVGGFMMGSAHLTSASTLNTAIQLQVDEAIRAKVLAVYITMMTATNPLGQLLLGRLIDATDPRFAYAVAGGMFISIGLVLTIGGRLSGLDDEVGSYEPSAAAEVHPSMPAPPSSYRA